MKLKRRLRFPVDPDLPNSRHQSLKALLSLTKPLPHPKISASVKPSPGHVVEIPKGVSTGNT